MITNLTGHGMFLVWPSFIKVIVLFSILIRKLWKWLNGKMLKYLLQKSQILILCNFSVSDIPPTQYKKKQNKVQIWNCPLLYLLMSMYQLNIFLSSHGFSWFGFFTIFLDFLDNNNMQKIENLSFLFKYRHFAWESTCVNF